jgi:broad specificity phosphatase PhoE
MIDLRLYTGKANFYFMRHGESAGNVARIPQGRADFPLSSKGREQAVAAARWFADQEVDLVLSSPLLRASETAEIIAREAELGPIQVREELNEVDIGPFSGLTWDEAGARYPQIKRQFLTHSWDGVPGAESSDVLYGRAEQVWQMVLGQLEKGARNILSVTHSGLIQWIIKTTLGNRTWLPLFPMGNCSVYLLILNNRAIPPDAAVDQETPAYYSAWKYIELDVSPPTSPEKRSPAPG